ncbi:ppp1r18 [Pungitius sinensis]
MSVSSLPEWKQLLLEKKRREEEQREKREKEEEKKLASMPAWKRGIIQRRKAKQDSLGDRERERDVCLLQVDVRSASDGQSDADSFLTVNLESEMLLSPDPGLWLDGEVKLASQVSLETIVPVHENPFIRTQSAWRKGRDAEGGNDAEVKEKDKEKSSQRNQDGESGRGREIEVKLERFRDVSEGGQKERSRDRSQGRENNYQWKELVKDPAREREFLKVRKDEEEKKTDSPPGLFSPLAPCLRTIRADNIIIIEQERKSSDERKPRWREAEREMPEEDQQLKRGMKMDLREIFAGGGSITEIRASEVLIIKPSASPEERSPEVGRGGGGPDREDGELICSMDERREILARELRTDKFWLREKGKERSWGHVTVIKDYRKNSLDDNAFVERGGRVSQLLSKFGQHPKPPSRSKSSDNFLQPARRKLSGDEDDQQSEADRRNMMKSVPKRSFSFSDRVLCAKENGLDDDGYHSRKTHQRMHSDRSGAPWVPGAGFGKEFTAKVKLGCTRLLDKDRFELHKDGHLKIEDDKGAHLRNEAEMHPFIQHRSEAKKVEAVDVRALERPNDADGDEGFTVASVKNTEGISFARKVPIRHEGRARAEREVNRQTGENSLEKEGSVETPSKRGEQIEEKVCERKVFDCRREEGSEITIPNETWQKSPVESASTESSSHLCAVTDRARDLHRGTESQGLYLAHSVLSQHTEELISKIEKIGDTSIYSNEKGERAPKAAYEMTKGSDLEIGSETFLNDATPRSPKRIAPTGIPPVPQEIQIPRSVFYVAEEMVDRKKTVGQKDEGKDREGGKGVERRDSWRMGKPLSRIESLREKIRQRELEKSRHREAQCGGGREGAEINDTQTAEDGRDERGTEIEKEWEAAAQMRKKPVEAERRQEDATAQTSTTAFDVTREVGVLKTCLQLPVHSQAVRGEEVTSGFATAPSEVISDSFQISEDENDPVKPVEEEPRCRRSQHEIKEAESEEEAEKERSEEEAEEYTSPVDPVQYLSPSPPHPSSSVAMSRIYNMEPVGSRPGMCLRERAVDIPPVHLVKVKPLVTNAQQRDGTALAGEDACGVQSIQRHIEQFQLKEQETLRSCASPNAVLKDRETKGHQSPRVVLRIQVKDDEKTPEKDQETLESNPNGSPQRVLSSTSPPNAANQATTVTSLHLRSQSPDNSLKTSDYASTPASSPCSPSPAQSPGVSPSPTPSPTHFSIRSASGGQVKRGATITITPKKTAGGGAAGPTTGSTADGSKPSKTLSQQAQMTSAAAEPVKKKFPTVEEIVVIGGYQNLDKSCLVKNKEAPKRGKVCFDEDQLEQVCEYPSEVSMLACTPFPHDQWRMERQQGEEVQKEEGEVEGGPIVSKSTRNVGITTGRGLRVDESCPR